MSPLSAQAAQVQGDSGSTRSALLVVNPVARSVTPALCAEVALELERLAGDVPVHCPSARGEAAGVVERAAAAAREHDRPLNVVCVGGDGTVREVAEAMARGLGSWPDGHARAAARLSVVPAGSGNSAYRAMWGPRKWKPSLLSASLMGPYRRVGSLDLLRIHETDRATVLGVNAGLGAQVAARLQHAPDVDDGRRAQIIGASVAQSSSFPGRLEVDGVTLHQGQITHVTIGGVPSFMGGLMQMLPQARVDDGLLDVCLMTEVDTHTLAEVLSLMRTGAHIHHPSIRYARGIRVVLKRTDGANLQLEHDGDVVPGSPRISVEIVPAAVPIATDRAAAEPLYKRHRGPVRGRTKIRRSTMKPDVTIPVHADFERAPGLLEGATTYELSPQECGVEFWLHAVAQGSLAGLVRGRRPSNEVPDFLCEPGPLRDNLMTEFAFRSLTEIEATRISALAAAAAPDVPNMDFYVTQAIDEARHADTFRGHLVELGVPEDELLETVERLARADAARIIDPLWDWARPIMYGDGGIRARYVDIVAIITILAEGTLAPTTELSELKWKGISPATADIERGACVDEIRHLTVGSWVMREHVRANPDDADRLVDLIAAGRRVWAELPTEEIILRREQQFQEGIQLHREAIGDYEIFPGRPLLDTTPEERMATALKWSEEIQESRLRYMGLSEAMPEEAGL